MTDSATATKKFSDEGTPYKGDETPFGHVHHMSDTLFLGVTYSDMYDKFTPRPKLRVDGYAACLRKHFSGKVLDQNDFGVVVNNSQTNRRRKIPDAMPISSVNEYVRRESTGEWFRVASHGTKGPTLRQVYVAPALPGRY